MDFSSFITIMINFLRRGKQKHTAAAVLVVAMWRDSFLHVDGCTSVSYTHLDVYKRQPSA